MKSFFSRFKNRLKLEYSGRYLEIILLEVIKENISILKILFPSININLLRDSKNLEINIEEIFPSKSNIVNYRRADIVVKYKGKHIALLEIKYEDQPMEYQLDDYLKYSTGENICFTYLTQYLPTKEDKLKLSDHASTYHLRYMNLYNDIIESSGNNNPVVKLFCQFLKENFMIYNKEIHEAGLWLLMIKGLNLKHSHGLRRKVSSANIKAIPVIWDTLISNVSILGDRFYNDLSEFFNNRFSLDFGFDPYFKLSLLQRDLLNSTEEIETLRRDRKFGGYFFISSNGKIKQPVSDDWLSLRLGYEFELDLKSKSLIKKIYVLISGKSFSEDGYQFLEIEKIPDESICYEELLKLTKSCIDNVFEENPKLLPSFKESLSNMKKSLEEMYPLKGL